MKLTRETHPETLERYAHLRPAKGRKCDTPFPGKPRSCTLAPGHSGPHVAHGALGRILAVWDTGAVAETSPESRRNRAAARTQGGLPSRRSGDLLAGAWARAMRILSSPEELFLFILFIAFTGFAVDWFLRILG